MIKAGARYLEHVCIAVMGVLHHHRLGSRQSVRDAVLVFVAYGLERQKEEMSKGEVKKAKSRLKLCTCIQTTELHVFYIKNTSNICSAILTEYDGSTQEGWRCVITNWTYRRFGQSGPHTGQKRATISSDSLKYCSRSLA